MTRPVNHFGRYWLVSFVVLAWLSLDAVPTQADPGPGWPHWRGPNRDGTTGETSHFNQTAWPPTPAAWKANVGIGSTSPVIYHGRVYTLGWHEGRDIVTCLDARHGDVLWAKAYRSPKYARHATGDEGLYAGVTATPELDPENGYLYTLSTDGDLNCWDVQAAGQRVWQRNLYDDFRTPPRDPIGRSPRRDYGFTSSSLVYKGTLVVEVGSPSGNLMGFDKQTGIRRWASENTDPPGHTAGPVPLMVGKIPCVAVLTLRRLLVARLDPGHEGHTLAEYPWETEFANSIASPAVCGDSLLLTSGYNHKAMCRLKVTAERIEKLWEQPYYSKVCTPVVYGGRIFCAWRKMMCLNASNGALLSSGSDYTGDAGSCVITGDRRLITWTHQGDLRLWQIPKNPAHDLKKLSEIPLDCRGDVWPHVVLAEGRLYCKDRWGSLFCFNLMR